MTKKKPEKRKSVTKKHPFQKFVQFNLGKTEREEIKASMMPAALAFDRLCEMIEDGYSFKLAWDARSSCMSAMMIGEFTAEDNKGCIMSARHSDLLTAINALLYQHVVMSDVGPWDKDDLDPFNNDW